MLRAVILGIALLVFLGVCAFEPAGTTAWPMAWAVLAVFAAFTLATFFVAEPDLMRERAAPGAGVERQDVVLSSLGFLGLYPGTFVVAGFDFGRGVPPAIPEWVQVAALLLFTLGYCFALWAMRCNRFFATFVRIQEERGHRVVESGPYAWMRHPGYAGALFAHLALPLALGSLWALIPAAIGTGLFVARTAAEDRTLARDLTGYREYQGRVPWRLVPHLW